MCGGFCLVPMGDGLTFKMPCPDRGLKECNYTRGLEKQRQQMLRTIGIKPRYWNPDPEKIRPREAVMRYCADIQEKTRTGKGMLITGSVGVGKTMILSYVAQRAWAEGIGVAYWYMPEFADAVADREARGPAIRSAKNIRLLMLDDFGVEYSSAWLVAILDEVFENRNAELLATFVTSNVTVDELKQDAALYRVVDRWRESMSLVTIAGESMRGE